MRFFWVVPTVCATRGFLLVSNRLDEVLVAAASVKAAGKANVTLVADEATLLELADRRTYAKTSPFDVVLKSEGLFPGLTTWDSMGFRLQKLQSLLKSPYDETVYLDSDVVACDDDLGEQIWLAMGSANVGGVAPRGGVINGGLLAYRRSAAPFFHDWIRRYRVVMDETRREQPVLQDTVANASAFGVTFRRLPRRLNCRGVPHCNSKCAAVHDHAAPANYLRRIELLDSDAVTFALTETYRRDCPALSGGHRVVAVVSDDSNRLITLQKKLEVLRKNNDAFPCRTNASDLKPCLTKMPRYAVIALLLNGNLNDLPRTAVRIVLIRHPATSLDVQAAAASLATCLATGRRADDCSPVARRLERWLGTDLRRHIVLLADRPNDSAALLERILPSHFLKLGSLDDNIPSSSSREEEDDDHAVQRVFEDLHRRIVSTSAAVGETKDRGELAARRYVMAALRRDVELYRSLVDLFDDRLAACGLLPSRDVKEPGASTHGTTTSPPRRRRRRRGRRQEED